MNRRYRLPDCVTALLIAAVTMLNACTTIPQDERLTVDQAIDLAVFAESTDAAFFALNRVIPSFAGLYRDPEGTILVPLTDGSQADAARPLIASYLRKRQVAESGSPETDNIRFVPAKWTWFDLDDYKARLTDVLSLPNMVYLDADEECNCVTIAVSQSDARPAVEQFVQKSGVPASAVRIIERPRIVPAQSLRDQFRPMKGGIRIKFNAFVGFGGYCTQTAVALRAGVLGLIMNSHCTRTQGGVESTEIYQAGLAFQNDFIATETVDPLWTASMPLCPLGKLCRRSDSAFASFASPSDGSLGKLALPTALCTTAPCSLHLTNATDELTITGLFGAPMVGDLRGKIGQTTGHTRGSVTATCIDTNQAPRSIFAPSNLTVLCQNFVGAAFGPGDSGAPVISLLSGNRAVLAGIAWGSGGGSYAFSAISDVEAELGPIALVAPVSTSTPPPPPVFDVCRVERNACMREVASRDGPRPQQCIRQYKGCKYRSSL